MTKRRAGKATWREAAATFVLRVELKGIQPAIWRRLRLPADMPLGILHHVLQEAFGWLNGHLHLFEVGDRQVSDPSFEWEEEMDDEDEVQLDQVLKRKRNSIVYVYDMGDNWRHTITLEDVQPASDAQRRVAVCEAGARKAPPEDCGGTWGYEDFLKAIRDPQHKEHARMLEWIGGAFDPEQFDIEEINEMLKKLRWR